MTEENGSWASATLKEVPFWREDMRAEEYDKEREYFARNFDLFRNEAYIPLWVQKLGAKEIQQWREKRYG